MFNNFMNNPYQMNPYQNAQNGPYGVQNQPVGNNVDWIKVSGYEDVEKLHVQNGTQAWMMDINNPIFYVKEADNMGMCTIKGYRFEEVEVKPQEVASHYATKEDIARIEQQILSLRGVNNESFNETTEINTETE